MPGSGLPLNTLCPMGYDVLLPRKNVADTSALGGTDRVPSVGEAWQSDRDNVRRVTGVGGMAAVSRGRGWFHVKPMAKPPPGALHKSLQTELSTESVTSRCRMALMD